MVMKCLLHVRCCARDWGCSNDTTDPKPQVSPLITARHSHGVHGDIPGSLRKGSITPGRSCIEKHEIISPTPDRFSWNICHFFFNGGHWTFNGSTEHGTLSGVILTVPSSTCPKLLHSCALGIFYKLVFYKKRGKSLIYMLAGFPGTNIPIYSKLSMWHPRHKTRKRCQKAQNSNSTAQAKLI
jgi:hypothetical protein